MFYRVVLLCSLLWSVDSAAVAGTRAYDKLELPTVTELWQDAVRLSGYSELCARAKEHCSMPVVVIGPMQHNIGEFDARNPSYITISDVLSPGSFEWSDSVVHEFTHYLQWLSGELRPLADCLSHAKLEMEAYKTDERWAIEQGVNRDYSGKYRQLQGMCVPTWQRWGFHPSDFQCEAAVIVHYSSTLTEEQWMEVVVDAETRGQITVEHGTRLKSLIHEAYLSEDKSKFIESNCPPPRTI